MKNAIKLFGASLVILATNSFAQTARPNDLQITQPISKGSGAIQITQPVSKGTGGIQVTQPISKGSGIQDVGPIIKGFTPYEEMRINDPRKAHWMMENGRVNGQQGGKEVRREQNVREQKMNQREQGKRRMDKIVVNRSQPSHLLSNPQRLAQTGLSRSAIVHRTTVRTPKH